METKKNSSDQSIILNEFGDWITALIEKHWNTEYRVYDSSLPTLEAAFEAGWKARDSFDKEPEN